MQNKPGLHVSIYHDYLLSYTCFCHQMRCPTVFKLNVSTGLMSECYKSVVLDFHTFCRCMISGICMSEPAINQAFQQCLCSRKSFSVALLSVSAVFTLECSRSSVLVECLHVLQVSDVRHEEGASRNSSDHEPGHGAYSVSAGMPLPLSCHRNYIQQWQARKERKEKKGLCL